MNAPGFTAQAALTPVRHTVPGGASLEASAGDTVEPAGPLAYAACVALCAWWMGPACLVACIPLFVAPSP